jgi:adenylylsulfate kinase
VAKLLLKHIIPVCVSLISPCNEMRSTTKKIIGIKFIEIYVKCPLNVCEFRDVKGLYQKARKNEVKYFTGISDIYEIPTNPDLIIDTAYTPLHDCVLHIVNYLKNQRMMPETIQYRHHDVTVELQ